MFIYFFRYAKLIVSEASKDEPRRHDNDLEVAYKEWRMYQIESRFGQDWCRETNRIKKRCNMANHRGRRQVCCPRAGSWSLHSHIFLSQEHDSVTLGNG